MFNHHHRLIARFGIVLAGSWLLAAGAAFALPDDQRQPIRVTSDSAVQENTTVTYRGNVIIEQGSIRIEADQVVINHDKGRMQRATATGKPVRFQQQPDTEGGLITGNADTIVYYAADQRIELLRNAFVDRDKSSVRGSRIEYLLPSKTVRAEGSTDNLPGRVDMVFQPSPEKADTPPAQDGNQPPATPPSPPPGKP